MCMIKITENPLQHARPRVSYFFPVPVRVDILSSPFPERSSGCYYWPAHPPVFRRLLPGLSYGPGLSK